MSSIQNLTKSRPTGLSRPGAVLMILSVVLFVSLFICTALITHGEEITGAAAIICMASFVGLGLAYFIGFIKYAGSKGYGFWIGFLLSITHLIGIIVLLLLPDRNS